MNGVYTMEIAEARVISAEHEILSLEVQKLLGECARYCDFIAESEESDGGSGALSKISSFFKKICSAVATFIRKIIEFLINIIKKPFSFIFALFSKGDDESSSSSGGGGSSSSSSSDDTTETKKTITSVSEETVAPVVKFKEFAKAAATQKNLTNMGEFTASDKSRLLVDTIPKHMSSAKSLGFEYTDSDKLNSPEFIKERLKCLKDPGFLNAISLKDNTDINRFVSIAKDFVGTGKTIKMQSTFGRMLTNPKKYSKEDMNQMFGTISKNLLAQHILLDFVKVSDRVDVFRCIYGPKMLKPEINKIKMQTPKFATVENMETVVIGNLSAEYIYKNYIKIALRTYKEEFDVVYPGEKPPKIENLKNAKHNVALTKLPEAKINKYDANFKFVIDKDVMSNIITKPVNTDKSLQDLTNYLNELKKPLEELLKNHTKESADKEVKGAILANLREHYYELANFVAVARTYSTAAVDMVERYKAHVVYNKSLYKIYSAAAIVMCINDFINDQYDKLPEADKKEFAVPMTKFKKRIANLGNDVASIVGKTV